MSLLARLKRLESEAPAEGSWERILARMQPRDYDRLREIMPLVFTEGNWNEEGFSALEEIDKNLLRCVIYEKVKHRLPPVERDEQGSVGSFAV